MLIRDLGHLATLVTVAEAGSISEAAKRLDYTAPAVSQQLAKLERYVGTDLLVRHHRGVSLTPSGEIIVDHARTIFNELSYTQEALSQVTESLAGHLRIGTFASGGIHLLPPVLSSFWQAHPNVKLRMQEYEPPAGIVALDEGEADLVLSHSYEYGPKPSTPKRITTETLLVEELVLVTVAGHALSHSASRPSWRDLTGRQLITGARGFANREALESLFRSEGYPAPNVAFETGNYMTACSLASAGAGIALVPRMMADAALPKHTFDVCTLQRPGLHRTITMAYRNDSNIPGIHTLKVLLRNAYK